MKMKRISCLTHIPCSHSRYLSEVKHSPLALHSQAWKTMSRMCARGQGAMRAMLCVDGICLVLKAVGRKNECSCTGRRRNAYTTSCPQTWISLDGDVRWERHILNTCFHICIFSFWRHFALLHALCTYSALVSFPSHAKTASPLMKSLVVLSGERPGGERCSRARVRASTVCLRKHWGTGAAEKHLSWAHTSHSCTESAPCLLPSLTPRFAGALVPQLMLPPKSVGIWSRYSGWVLWGVQLRWPLSPSPRQNVPAVSRQTALSSLLSAKGNLIDLSRR